MSSSVLYSRLRELVGAGVVVQGEDGSYEFAALGVKLGTALLPLLEWSDEWAQNTGAAAEPGATIGT